MDLRRAYWPSGYTSSLISLSVVSTAALRTPPAVSQRTYRSRTRRSSQVVQPVEPDVGGEVAYRGQPRRSGLLVDPPEGLRREVATELEGIVAGDPVLGPTASATAARVVRLRWLPSQSSSYAEKPSREPIFRLVT